MGRIIHHNILRYKTQIPIIIATGFGSGYLPKAPGTWGSAVALPFAYAMSYWGNYLIFIAVIIGFLVGVIVSDITATSMGEKDPSKIVIDEIIGQWITLLIVPPNVILYLCGFLLFRFFDILKPWPISWVEKKFSGGFGIMIDDVFAACYASLILNFFWSIYKDYTGV